MDELYVVIGTDGLVSWVCQDTDDRNVFEWIEEAEKLKSYFDNATHLYGEYTYKVAKLSFLD